MTREELITIICNDTSKVTCKGNCDLPEEEGNTGECCRKCAERLLEEYEVSMMQGVADTSLCELNRLKNKIDTSVVRRLAEQLKKGRKK